MCVYVFVYIYNYISFFSKGINQEVVYDIINVNPFKIVLLLKQYKTIKARQNRHIISGNNKIR